MTNVVSVANRSYTNKQIALIRDTVARDCNPEEFDLFIEVARRSKLDPFRRQIHAVVFNKNKPDRRQMSIITGIDGYRAIAARCGDYRPSSEAPEIETDESAKDELKNPHGIVRAVVKVHKLGPDKQWYDVVGEARWEEFAPLKDEWIQDPETRRNIRSGRRIIAKDAWLKMPFLMIAKCAEAQALRRGWPEELSGLYAQEEMDQALAEELSASEAAKMAETENELKRIRSANTITILWRAGEPLEQVPLGELHDRCAAFIQSSDSMTEIRTWAEQNRQSIREFHARAKADALGVKEIYEKRCRELAAEEESEKDGDEIS